MSAPSLSILVPIYNAEAYLRECLDSLTHQSLSDLELILINDGSTDNSLKIIQSYAAKDPRITIINKENSGYGDSMNRALRKAKGTYIGIIEPDDWVEREAFKILLRTAEEFHADVVKANYYRFKTIKPHREPNSDDKSILPQHKRFVKTKAVKTVENSVENSRKPLTAASFPALFQFAPAIWSAIYRREFLLENDIKFLPTPGASYQDLSFSFKVWATAKTVVLLEEAFVHYRLDNGNSSVNNPGKINCVVDEYSEIETFLTEHGLFEEFGPQMAAAKFRNYHWNFQRLPASAARAFYATWLSEMRSARSEPIAFLPYLSSKDRLALTTMLHTPRLAYYFLRLRSRLRRLHKL